MGRFVDLTGRRFGRWRVVAIDEHIGIEIGWMCQCDCGQHKAVRGSALRSGQSQSCGCLQRERVREANRIHGEAGRTPEWRSWANMMERCYSNKPHLFKYYGARKIEVCPEWFDFRQFLKDMGRKPGIGYSIERKNNDGKMKRRLFLRTVFGVAATAPVAVPAIAEALAKPRLDIDEIIRLCRKIQEQRKREKKTWLDHYLPSSGRCDLVSIKDQLRHTERLAEQYSKWKAER